jgi:hypothetical protein
VQQWDIQRQGRGLHELACDLDPDLRGGHFVRRRFDQQKYRRLTILSGAEDFTVLVIELKVWPSVAAEITHHSCSVPRGSPSLQRILQ